MKTVEMNPRGWEILNAVDKFLREYSRWMLEPYAHIDARLSDSIDAMLNIIPGECPPGFKAMMYWLNEMKKAVDAFDASEEGEVADGHPALNAVEQLQKVRDREDPTPKSPIEPIAWYEANATMRHAAMAYGLYDVKGEPRADLAQRELDQPGSILENGLVRDDIPDWEKPLPFPKPQATEAETKKTPTAVEPTSEIAPEPLEELLSIGVSDAQIARMKQMEIGAVQVARATWNRDREQSRARAEMEASQISYREKYETEEAADTDDEGEYAAYDDDQLKELCRDRTIAVRGNPKRSTLIAKLREAEANA